MKKLKWFALLIAIISGNMFSFAQSKSDESANAKIVNTEWLTTHQKDPDLVILHVASIRAEYKREHIEGSLFLWPGWLSNSTPEGNVERVSLTEMKKTINELGITPKSKILLTYTNGYGVPACRMYLMFDYLGFGEQTYVLNGGIEAWKSAGNSVTSSIPITKKSKMNIKPNQNIFADSSFILKKMKDSNYTIIDARSPQSYEGKTGFPRAGHIPGAVNLSALNVYDNASNKFVPDDNLLEAFTKLNITKDKKLITYCMVGNSASIVYLVARHLGYSVFIYDGSMEEWANNFDLPIEIDTK